MEFIDMSDSLEDIQALIKQYWRDLIGRNTLRGVYCRFFYVQYWYNSKVFRGVKPGTARKNTVKPGTAAKTLLRG
jgi:hypothetical protein